jgi:apolipoprotein D and lipocalin family protein
MKKLLLAIAVMLLAAGCVRMPQGIEPVTGFEINRYLGTWYEIARLDHSFERGLHEVTATYTPREDGGIDVLNRGYNPEKDQWREATGKAYFVEDPATGRLKVSFWGPFYGAYNIIALDKKDYSYAMVCGPTRSYFWILAREPDMPDALKAELVAKASRLGFETDELIYVRHTMAGNRPD